MNVLKSIYKLLKRKITGKAYCWRCGRDMEHKDMIIDYLERMICINREECSAIELEELE